MFSYLMKTFKKEIISILDDLYLYLALYLCTPFQNGVKIYQVEWIEYIPSLLLCVM